jgi:hypothetical protein
MNISPMNLTNFPIPVQYYGLNASDFFGGKVTWPDCRAYCIAQHFSFNYWGIYKLIMPLMICLMIFIVLYYISEVKKPESERNLLALWPYIIILLWLGLFMLWYVLMLKGVIAK